MIDRIRRDIQNRLGQLLAEAEKLKRALTALNGLGPSLPSPAPRRAQPRERATQPAAARRARRASSGARAAGGATRIAVLEGLAKSGEAMTAGELAAVTGLARGTGRREVSSGKPG